MSERAPPNKGMKQTKPAQAMELRSLSPVFGGHDGSSMRPLMDRLDRRHLNGCADMPTSSASPITLPEGLTAELSIKWQKPLAASHAFRRDDVLPARACGDDRA